MRRIVIDRDINNQFAATASLQILELLTEIRELAKEEKVIEAQVETLHKRDIDLVFLLGEKLEKLHGETPFGEWMITLKQTGLSSTSVTRKRRVWEVFGQYRAESWIYNFKKSAFGIIALHQEQPGLIEDAIALAKRGIEVGAAWASTHATPKRSGKEPRESRTKLSGKLREIVYQAIELVGEERVLEALAGLLEGGKT